LSPANAPALSLSSPRSLIETVNELLRAKAAAGKRERYLVELRHALKLFCNGRGDRPLPSLTTLEIETWLNRPAWAPATRKSYLTDIRTLFNFSVRRGYLDRSPADGVERPCLEPRPPKIHTPVEVAAMLHTAARLDVDVARVLSLQYFAGIRPAEALRLVETDLLPQFVQVSAAASKIRQRRLVDILPALRSWLDVGGQLPVVNFVRRFRRVRAASGVVWSPDVTRHSFASYHLAEFRNADLTAHLLGHGDTQMLFRHYRELVTPDAAREFWAIRP